ncbi:sodium/bile acid cotransporter 7-like isoform X2 [Physella acuta]|uniref:sodium/bile acid cotransporter 7-like isoform X2 n=1 Tax=Physella acuta TaxID=109671 RepID=UPI0027DE3FB7|nr:sodium/bile acid cotransporter 7-like isoform X2 [Physella acuta]
MKSLYFCTGIVVSIILARLNPNIGAPGGLLKPELTVKYLAVSMIFLNGGLNIPTETLTAAVKRWDIHLFVQVFAFVVFPVIVYTLVTLLKYTFLHPALLDGLLILSAMPPPVSSAIILTRLVGGNEAAALFNSVFGSMLGIFLTPPLILFILGSKEVEIPSEQILKQLILTVVVPLICGLVFRNYKRRWLLKQNIPFNLIGHLLTFYIIYATFCATFTRSDLSLDYFSLITTGFIITLLLICIHLFLIVISYRIMGFSAYDTISIMYVGSQKSLNIGMPVIEIIFEGNPNISYLSVPLLIYNPMQIVLGGMSIELLERWLNSHRNSRRTSARNSYWYYEKNYYFIVKYLIFKKIF